MILGNVLGFNCIAEQNYQHTSTQSTHLCSWCGWTILHYWKQKASYFVMLLKWLLNILRHLLLVCSALWTTAKTPFFLLHSVVYKSSLQPQGSTAASTVTQSLIQSLDQHSETVCMVSTKGEKNLRLMTTIGKVNTKYNNDKGIKHMQNSYTKLHHMENKYLQEFKHCLRWRYLSYLNG